MRIGIVADLRRYPVKSLRGESLERARIESDGLAGDRTSALFAGGAHARAGKTLRGKEHDRLHLIDAAGEAVASAARRGIVAEVRDGARYFDAAPVSIVVDRWLEGVAEHLGAPVEYERFRPNLFVRASDGFAGDEGSLEGATLELGETRLRVRCGIERCVAVTYDPNGGASEPRVLRYLAQRRGAILGIYCDVLRAGEVRVGDALTVAER